ncbi:MAG: phenylacetate--CoA ligase [Planctomycetota bacterium]|jgi:phenylacetate-CoA ligase|nr:phenylacetate--CoA ligase [Planctomycetota bacterium]
MSSQEKRRDPPFQATSAMDFLPGPQMRELQIARLRKAVDAAYHGQRCGLMKQRMDAAGVKPDDVRTLDDIRRLPFSTKADLRDTYPYGMFCRPDEEVVRIHASSGTTGKPIVAGYTRNDLDVWADSMRRGMIGCGLSHRDIIQVSYGYGLFTGGLGAHCGAEALGAMVIPTSAGNTERQVMILHDLGSTAICCTPSYFAHIAEKAPEFGVDIRKTRLRIGIFGAEPWSDGLRRHIEETTGIQAQDIYGLTEIIGPGVAIECLRQDGLHIFEDYFYPEIIDPDTEEVLPDGEEGELVITTLAKEAIPMIRYRTRDITAIIPGRCACGRTVRRIRRIGRRSDDMMIIRGVNVFPSQIESAILRVKGLSPNYQIVLTREHELDQMEVRVELAENALGDRILDIEEIQKSVGHSIFSITGLHARITLAESKSIARSEGKAKRVIDKRTI